MSQLALSARTTPESGCYCQMSFLSRLFDPPLPPLMALWNWVTATARQPRWYADHAVADNIDGRFDMVALVTSLVMLEMEKRGMLAETSLLTERFAADMDGSLRALGISDMVMGKHMGRVVGALGGRVGAYRTALATTAPPTQLAETLARNVYRGGATPEVAEKLAAEVRALAQHIAAASDTALLEGTIA